MFQGKDKIHENTYKKMGKGIIGAVGITHGVDLMEILVLVCY